MASQIPGLVWAIVLTVDVAIVAFAVAALWRQRRPHAHEVALGTGALLAAWLGLAALLSSAQAFAGPPGAFPTIALGVLGPIAAGALALAASRRVRERALAIPAASVVAIQSARLVGVVFLVLLGRGVLPAHFALPAGWGDAAVGATAPAVAWALHRRWRWAPRLAVAWNALGLLDLLVAVGMGALSASGAVRVLTSGPSASAMAELPLSLVPTFGVPAFVLLHVVSLLGLRRAHAGAPTVHGPRAEYA